MVSTLLLVFLLQLMIHVINTVGKQTINDVLWLLYTKLPTSTSKQTSDLTHLRSEVLRLHTEMKATSAQDEFAKWAKLRRQHDKAKDKHDTASRNQQSFRSTFDRLATLLRWLGTQGLNFFANTYFSKEAMFWLPQGWVPYHVEWVLSFPRAPVGSISINVWAIACASVISLGREAVVAVWTLREGEVVVGERKGEKLRMEMPMEGRGGGEKEL